MEKIAWEIYLLRDKFGKMAAAVAEEPADGVMVCGLKDRDGKLLHFESEAHHLFRWSADNGIEYRSISLESSFEELWNTIPAFHVGDPVLYIPNHAAGQHGHPDCERGVVHTATGHGAEQIVWVRYKHGDTGDPTPISNLLKL